MGNVFSLAAISSLSLFYELVFIRWLPANISSTAYFSNIVLISSFFGLGLGFMIPSRKRDLFPLFPPLLAVVVTIFILFRDTGVLIPADSGEWIWSNYTENFNLFRPSHAKIGIIPVLMMIFFLTAVLFVPLGQKTRYYLEQFPPLKGYGISIAGSIFGIVVFTLFSTFYRYTWIPLGWFILGGLVCLLLMKTGRQLAVGALSTVLLWGLVVWSSQGEIWSPYYVIQRKNVEGDIFVYVNKFFHQAAVDFDNNYYLLRKYSIPYSGALPKQLLVLGAGMGNDLAVALRNGVTDIDAVEIDPEILALGKSSHPNRPYDSPHVRPIVDDARSFLKKASKKYDMVVLGTLDSHALLSGLSNVRLDNFVYTRECLEDIQARLTADGVVVLLYSFPRDWLAKKMVEMAAISFPNGIHFALMNDPALFNLMIIAGPGADRLIENIPDHGMYFIKVPPGIASRSDIPSDDWPYLHLEKRWIPSYYLAAIALLTAISAFLVFLVLPEKSRTLDLPFLFLGCGFLLLETKSLTTLSLLFGSTWLVNAFVFMAILGMALLANLTVSMGKFVDLRLILLCLIGSIALNYLIPPRAFLGQMSLIQWGVPCFLAALPIYFAGIMFSRLLTEATDIGMVYGSNLVGAVAGGFIEYASMLLGLKFLFVLAASCYLLALLTSRRGGRRSGLAGNVSWG
jgi:hypothetical protein